MPKISIIIPIYNLWDLTQNCLSSLAKYCSNIEYEIIIINNGSTEMSKADILSFGQNLFAQNFRLIQLEDNLGFAKACNIGAKLAKSDILFFLNNDTLAFQNFLDPILNLFQDQEKIIVAPLLLYNEPNAKSFDAGRVQHLGITFNPNLSVEHLYSFFPYTHPVVQKKRKVQALSAAALFIRKQFFLELDGFFEDFINGFEDIDLSQRASDLGAELVVEPNSILIHLESRTLGRKDKEQHNTKILGRRSGDKIYPDIHTLMQADGYCAYLSDSCELQFKLNDEQEQELLRSTQKNLSLLYTQIIAEPLWKAGYNFFWKNFTTRCDHHLCLNLALLESNFFNEIPVLARLCYYMTELDEDASHILQKVTRLQNLQSNPAIMQQRSQLIVKKAKQFNDNFLINLYAPNNN